MSRRAVIGRQAVWFTAIGGAMTLSYLMLYAALRGVLGPQPANYLAWTVTAVADTAANRHLTFHASGRISHGRAQVEGFLVFTVGLVLTSAALTVLDHNAAQPGQLLELATLAAANLAAGLLRFELLRRWVFNERRGHRVQLVVPPRKRWRVEHGRHLASRMAATRAASAASPSTTQHS